MSYADANDESFYSIRKRYFSVHSVTFWLFAGSYSRGGLVKECVDSFCFNSRAPAMVAHCLWNMSHTDDESVR
jgi:hypothetical protein